MGIELDVYYVYALTTRGGDAQLVCFTAHRPGYGNARQQEEDAAEARLDEHRSRRLAEAIATTMPRSGPVHARLIGYSYAPPVGEDLYDARPRRLELWLAYTLHGKPSAVVGTAHSEEAFWAEILADSELAALRPQPPVLRLSVSYLG